MCVRRMMLQTVSNLYPYPGQPTRGMFNAQLFAELAKLGMVSNTVLVASPKPWTWSAIRGWVAPQASPPTRYLPYLHIPVIGRALSWRFAAHALRHRRLPHGGAVAASSGVASAAATDAHQVVLASWLYPDGIASAAAFGDATTAVWVMVLGTDVEHLKHPTRKTIVLRRDACIAGYICVSQNLRDALIDAGIAANKAHVIRNGVDTTRFHSIPRLDAAEGLCRPIGDGPLICWIGNLVPVKAPEVALRAFARVARPRIQPRQDGACGADPRPTGMPGQGPQLVFIGDGPLHGMLGKLADELGVSDRVCFVGRRPHTEITKWLNVADCLVLSSRSEGMPNAVAEALACGTPVVATDVGACREMLAGQPCCRIAPRGDVDALAGGIDQVLREAKESPARPVFRRTWTDMAREIGALLGFACGDSNGSGACQG